MRFDDLCPAQFKAVYIDKTAHIEDSEAMRLGRLFEYLITGEGEAMEPKTTKTGIAADDQRVIENAENAKNALKYYGLPKIAANEKFEVKLIANFETGTATINLKGIFDYRSERNGLPLILDFKNSGLIFNKWEPTAWHPETFKKNYLVNVQGLHYAFMWYLATGVIPLVAFLIYTPKNSRDAAFFVCEYTQESLNEHLENVKFAWREIYSLYLNDKLQPVPEKTQCYDCPVKDCPARTNIPKLYNFHF